MPTFTMEVSQEVVDTLARKYNYNPATDGVKGAFVRSKVIGNLKLEYREFVDYEKRQALAATPDPDIT